MTRKCWRHSFWAVGLSTLPKPGTELEQANCHWALDAVCSGGPSLGTSTWCSVIRVCAFAYFLSCGLECELTDGTWWVGTQQIFIECICLAHNWAKLSFSKMHLFLGILISSIRVQSILAVLGHTCFKAISQVPCLTHRQNIFIWETQGTKNTYPSPSPGWTKAIRLTGSLHSFHHPHGPKKKTRLSPPLAPLHLFPHLRSVGAVLQALIKTEITVLGNLLMPDPQFIILCVPTSPILISFDNITPFSSFPSSFLCLLTPSPTHQLSKHSFILLHSYKLDISKSLLKVS